jgi:acyl transferase domain-containing protein
MVDIAIVGFSFKLPQDVDDVSSLWGTLQDRKNLMTGWPESRISNASFEANKHSKVRRLFCAFSTNSILTFSGRFTVEEDTS